MVVVNLTYFFPSIYTHHAFRFDGWNFWSAKILMYMLNELGIHMHLIFQHFLSIHVLQGFILDLKHIDSLVDLFNEINRNGVCFHLPNICWVRLQDFLGFFLVLRIAPDFGQIRRV